MKYWIVSNEYACDIEVTRQDGKDLNSKEAVQVIRDFIMIQDEKAHNKGAI